ncbi:phosphotransferase [Alicyclobacillus tolerans]|uniref:Ser/Thr protein kinase RdoA (MazF antagonist) n=1 Tax=Alicyclobacillus tolerans TaxID=90970 RepID=A0ABT9LSL7_9BACL|nr:aminoglycoside phosphotransferase family protein [Alicyclobacillus tengchongensis]MDP9727254.1 Ser/Thr protein kinase RdoA (MazF antagonist) [Alicyclobacillus tengchongensis]
MALLAEGAIREIASYYGLNVIASIERRTVTGLITADGQNYVWKFAEEKDSEKRLAALSKVSQLLQEKGIRFAVALPNQNHVYLTRLHTIPSLGYLQPWLPGRHLNLGLPNERMAAIHALAQLHQIPVQRMDASVLSHHTPLQQRIFLKARALSGVWKDACERCPPLEPFSVGVLKQVAQVLEEPAPFYRQLVEFRQLSFCHRDLAPHNLLVGPAQEVQLIDFDQSGLDDPLYDVAQIANHSLFLGNLQAGDWRKMMDAYVEAAHLSPLRERLLWRILAWPDILARSLVEWAKRGYPADDWARVHYALKCESKRRQLLYSDSPYPIRM